jgi:hypothetical protein
MRVEPVGLVLPEWSLRDPLSDAEDELATRRVERILDALPPLAAEIVDMHLGLTRGAECWSCIAEETGVSEREAQEVFNASINALRGFYV